MKMKLLGACLSVSLLLPTPAIYGCGLPPLVDDSDCKKIRLVILALNVAAVAAIACYFYAKKSKCQQHKHECCKHNA
jgi:hypothetical protein